MADWTDELRAAARSALPPLEGELLVPGAARARRGAPRPLGDPVPHGGLARRPLVRAGIRHGLRAALPDRSRAARGERPAVGAVLRADAGAGPLRARDRLQPDRGPRGGAVDRGVPRHVRALRRGRAGVGGRDAGSTRRVRPPRRARRPPQRPRGVGRRLRPRGVGALGELGLRAAPRPPGRAPGAGRGARPPPPAPRGSSEPGRRRAGGPPARRAAARPRAGLEQLGGRGVADGEREAAAGERPAPAGPAAGRVVRAPSAGAGVRGPRRRVPVRARDPRRRDPAPRLGDHERDRRRPGPVRGAPERRRRGRRVRGRVGAPHRPPRGDRGPRRRRRDGRRARDAARPAARGGGGRRDRRRVRPPRALVRAPLDGGGRPPGAGGAPRRRRPRRASRRSARRYEGCPVPARTSCTPTSTGRSAISSPAAIPCAAAATARRRSPAGRRITSGIAGSPTTISRGRGTPIAATW